jgi:hypothetical protein
LRRLRRTRIRIEFGEVFMPEKPMLNAASPSATTQVIMRYIAAMLPPGYRVVYAG